MFAVVAQAAVPQSTIDAIIKDAQDGTIDGNWTAAEINATLAYIQDNPSTSSIRTSRVSSRTILASLQAPGEQGGQLAFTGGEVFLVMAAGAALIGGGSCSARAGLTDHRIARRRLTLRGGRRCRLGAVGRPGTRRRRRRPLGACGGPSVLQDKDDLARAVARPDNTLWRQPQIAGQGDRGHPRARPVAEQRPVRGRLPPAVLQRQASRRRSPTGAGAASTPAAAGSDVPTTPTPVWRASTKAKPRRVERRRGASAPGQQARTSVCDVVPRRGDQAQPGAPPSPPRLPTPAGLRRAATRPGGARRRPRPRAHVVRVAAPPVVDRQRPGDHRLLPAVPQHRVHLAGPRRRSRVGAPARPAPRAPGAGRARAPRGRPAARRPPATRVT